jgi:hypothetical protein|tara:strand:- start:2410 stop:2961 length:552 start_codon:yes stop_codon:yes gene_type:complete
MIKEYEEKTSSNFEGTIIDTETIGEFNGLYRKTNDSRRYEHIKQVIFGFISKQGLHIFYVKERKEIPELSKKITGFINQLERPFYAFNTDFESGVWFHQLNHKVIFDGELNREKYEPKAEAIRNLGISNYDDPFYDNGLLCMKAWENRQFDKAIAHNRACLLKERDILLQRGYRPPNALKFHR